MTRPILQHLDAQHNLTHALFRDACRIHPDGSFLKDLRLLGRDLRHVIMVDDNPQVVRLQPENALLCKPYVFGWIGFGPKLTQSRTLTNCVYVCV